MSLLLFDSRNPLCKSPFGAVPAGQEIHFSLFLPIADACYSPTLLVYEADAWELPRLRIPLFLDKGDGADVRYSCVFQPEQAELLFYLFEVTTSSGLRRIVRGPDGRGEMTESGAQMWQLTVYDSNLSTPDFLKTGIMYQIFPDRFYNSGSSKQGVPTDRKMHTDWYELPDYLPDKRGEITNSDYFGGDLAGITAKLPYLREMGVTVLYLNPIFEAHSNHRYNTADYRKIDPLLGTEEDMRTLCAEASALGIHILLDGVFNHTGSDSVYFNRDQRYGNSGAFNDPSSPYYSWYEFNNYPNQYNSWWGFITLPSLNKRDAAYTNFICGENGVLQKWLDCGISGWRLDVADELPDVFLDQICASIRRANPEAAVLGEVWEDASIKIAYGVRRRYLLGGQLDSVMNYPFKDAILAFIRDGAGAALYEAIEAIREHYPKPVLDVLMNPLSTHDVERAITALGSDPVVSHTREWQGRHNRLSAERYTRGRAMLRLASLIQYTLPGIPCLYYGDEAGLYGYKDPFNRSCYPWGREDTLLLDWFRQLGALRTTYPTLSSGNYLPLLFDRNLAVYQRDCGEDQLLIAVNRSETSASLPLPAAFAQNTRQLLGQLDHGNILPACECVVLAVISKHTK